MPRKPQGEEPECQGEASRPTDPDVFDYLDYRAYLRELYSARKKRGSFSYRAFSLRAQLKSPNYLKLVIDGERNLTQPMAKRFAVACGLAGQASSFFCELVAFGQAGGIDERNDIYLRLHRDGGTSDGTEGARAAPRPGCAPSDARSASPGAV
ncbi:MAG: hypothetical protein RJA70_603 [Pseudomonadota bacterium]|jgi:uncharacterized protein (TIGR02147 family)